MLDACAAGLTLSTIMPLTLKAVPFVPSVSELRMPDGNPLLMSRLSIHPSVPLFVQFASIPRKSRSFAVEKLGLKISVSGVGVLVVELVERARGPKNEAFIVVPVKPTAQRLATRFTEPAKYSMPEEGLVK